MRKPFRQGEEIAVLRQNFPDMRSHPGLLFQKAHQKPLRHQSCRLLTVPALPELPDQTGSGRLRHPGNPVNQTQASSLWVNLADTDGPRQNPALIPAVQQIRPLGPPCKPRPQIFHPIEKTAHGQMLFLCKQLQRHFLTACFLNLDSVFSALFLKIREQRRPIRILTERPRLRSGIQLLQNPQRQIGGRTVFPLHKRRERRVLKFIEPRLLLAPKSRQPFRHGQRADDVIRRKRLFFPARLPPRADKLMEHRALVNAFRTFPIGKPLPHFLIKTRALHAAGIAVQRVRRFHRIRNRIDALILIRQPVKLHRFRRKADAFRSFQKLHQSVRVKSSGHHQNLPVIRGRLRNPLRHIPFPQQAPVRFQLFLWRMLS